MIRAMPGLIAGIIACTRTPPPPVAEPLPFNTLGSARHATPPSTGSPDTIPSPPAQIPKQLQELAAATQALTHQHGPEHAELVRAIHALADALALVDPTARDYIAAIHSVAERLGDSPRRSSQHADLLRVALDRTRTVLARSTPRNRWDMREYATSLTRFTDIVTAIDPDLPLVDQQWRVKAALAAALTTIEVAVGLAAQ